jgi:hypothetical protein
MANEFKVKNGLIVTEGGAAINGGTAMNGSWVRSLYLESAYPVIVAKSTSGGNKFGAMGYDGGAGWYWYVNANTIDVTLTAAVMSLSNTGALTATSFIKSGGTASQFLKADGSVDSSTYLTSASLNNYVDFSSTQTAITGRKAFTNAINEISNLYLEYDANQVYLGANGTRKLNFGINGTGGKLEITSTGAAFGVRATMNDGVALVDNDIVFYRNGSGDAELLTYGGRDIVLKPNNGSGGIVDIQGALTGTSATFSGTVTATTFIGALTGTATNASAFGSQSLSQFVYGTASRRGVNLITDWNQTTYPDVAFLSSENNATNAPNTDYTYGLQYSFHRDGHAYRTQIVTDLYSDADIYVRNLRDVSGAGWSAWFKLWHSGDFSSTNITQWNTAYNWGNHASAGYAIASNYYTSTQIQNYFGGTSAMTGYNKTNWDTAYGWGNHAGKYHSINYTTGVHAVQIPDTINLNDIDTNISGYVNIGGSTNQPSGESNGHLVSYGVDTYYSYQTYVPYPRATPSYYFRIQDGGTWGSWNRMWSNFDFTSTNISNWNTAYGWGNHAGAGYLTSASLSGYWNSSNDGSGSGLDADVLDGVHGSSYMRTDVADTSVAMKTFYTSMSSQYDYVNSPISIRERGLVGAAQSSAAYAPNLNFHWGATISRSLLMGSNGQFYNADYASNGVPLIYKIWTEENDGSGSGLDADLLDGLHSSSFMLRSSSSQSNPNLYFASSAYRFDPHANNPVSSEYYGVLTYGNESNVVGQLATHYVTGETYTRAFNSAWSGWNKLWSNNNDGSGSGLDADLLDGQQGSYYYPASNPNGYISSSAVSSSYVPYGGASATVDLNTQQLQFIGGGVIYMEDSNNYKSLELDPNNRVYRFGDVDGNNTNNYFLLDEAATTTQLHSNVVFATTDNRIKFENTSGFGNMWIRDDNGTDRTYLNWQTLEFYDSGYNYIHGLDHAAGFTGTTILSFPDAVGSQTIPVNVNGYYADTSGSISLSAAAVGALSNSTNSSAAIRALFLDRQASNASGISHYSAGYKAWATYMASGGATGQGPTNNITASTGAIVTSWALRSFIENASGYGWIWETGTSGGNPSAIAMELSSNTNALRLNGHFLHGANTAKPLASWSNGNMGSTGAVMIKLPGTSTNYGMLNIEIETYEYNGNGATKYIIGGHNWTSGTAPYWYNYSVRKIGPSVKSVRLGYHGGQFCIILGDDNSTWDYGSVAITSVRQADHYSGVMNLGGTYTITQSTSAISGATWTTGDLRVEYTGNISYWHAGNDGSGSGLDADLLDGYNSSIVKAASTVVVRDINSGISAQDFNASRGDGTGVIYFAPESNGGNRYLYYNGTNYSTPNGHLEFTSGYGPMSAGNLTLRNSANGYFVDVVPGGATGGLRVVDSGYSTTKAALYATGKVYGTDVLEIVRATTTSNDPQIIGRGANNMAVHVGAYADATSSATTKYAYIQASENGVSNDRDLILNPIAGSIKAPRAIEDTTYTTQLGAYKYLPLRGKKLNADEDFATGTNSVSVYNNSGGGTVTITRGTLSGVPNSSGYALTIATTGTASPGLGGFTFGTMTAANKQFITRFVAKIPVGYTVNWASNGIGSNSSSKWMTSQAGTGKWEEYAFLVQSGDSGTFSNTNYFYLSHASLTTVTWYLASATVYDITDQSTSGVASAGGSNGQLQYNSSGMLAGLAFPTNGATVLGHNGSSLVWQKSFSFMTRQGVNDVNTSWFSNDTEYLGYSTLTAARTVTLPSATTFTGCKITIADETGNCSTSNTITLNRAGSDTIEGATSYVLSSANASVTLYSTGSKWVVIGLKGLTSSTPLFADGSAGAPSIAFANDPDTGFYSSSSGSDLIDVSTGGVQRFQFDGSGVFRAADDVIAYYSFSDLRLKDNVQYQSDASMLDKVLALKPVTYEWKDGRRAGKTELGLIAQDVEQIIPEVVSEETRLGDEELYKRVDYEKLTAALIGAVKELTAKVVTLEQKVKELGG